MSIVHRRNSPGFPGGEPGHRHPLTPPGGCQGSRPSCHRPRGRGRPQLAAAGAPVSSRGRHATSRPARSRRASLSSGRSSRGSPARSCVRADRAQGPGVERITRTPGTCTVLPHTMNPVQLARPRGPRWPRSPVRRAEGSRKVFSPLTDGELRVCKGDGFEKPADAAIIRGLMDNGAQVRPCGNAGQACALWKRARP